MNRAKRARLGSLEILVKIVSLRACQSLKAKSFGRKLDGDNLTVTARIRKADRVKCDDPIEALTKSESLEPRTDSRDRDRRPIGGQAKQRKSVELKMFINIIIFSNVAGWQRHRAKLPYF